MRMATCVLGWHLPLGSRRQRHLHLVPHIVIPVKEGRHSILRTRVSSAELYLSISSWAWPCVSVPITEQQLGRLQHNYQQINVTHNNSAVHLSMTYERWLFYTIVGS